MEIDITEFFTNADPFDFSASVAERGPNAGPETWSNALSEAADKPLLSTPEQLEALRDYVKGYGAWSKEEIEGWSDDECNALFIQMVSGDIREARLDTDEPDWEAHQKGVEAGRYSGSIYPGDDGRIYYYLGS